MRRAILRLVPVVSLSILVSAFPLAAQDGSMRVTIPSPNAASLGKFGDVPVSLYTGVPDISIPLFTAQGRTLQLPIVLKYHAGGIKAEEIGSWVGIGWTIEAGGTITRTVHGLVDELASGYYNTGNTLYDPANWPTPSSTLIQNIRTEQVDGEPDQFFFDFAGRSGQFVLGPTSTSTTIKEYRAIPHQDLRIEPQGVGSGSIGSWVITTEDGTKYTFGAAETSAEYTLVGTTFGAHYGQQYTSSWHLTEIRSPGGDVITLQYASYDVRHRMDPYYEEFDQVQTPPGLEACRPDHVETTNETGHTTAQLSAIVTAKHTITFTAGTSLRTDALSPNGTPQEPRLDHITVKTPAGTVLRTFQFDQDYSTGRLTLKNVYEQDRNGVALPPYTFTYDGTGLPDRFTYAIDHWGFYNGASNNTYLPPGIGFNGAAFPGADRNPNFAYMKAGVLTQITYPTGGYDQFTYEANDYGSVAGSPPMADQFHSANADSWSNPNVSFTIGGSQTVIVTVIAWQTPGDCWNQINPPCPYTSIDGQYYSQASSNVSYIALPPGTYTMHANDMGLYPDYAAGIEVRWNESVPVAKKTAGGLRIAEVRAADALGNVTYHEYKYTLESDPTRSSGVISSEPDYDYQFVSQPCTYYSRSSASRMPLGDGPVVGYREVTVWLGANGEFGKTRHRFRSVENIGDAPSDSWPFFRRTSFEWQRGQDTATTDYNATGAIQRRTAASYVFPTDTQTYRSFHGLGIYSMRTAMGTELFVGVDLYNAYQVISAWSYMTADTTVTYDEAGTSSFTTARNYVYGNLAHLQLTEMTETNSDGTQRITRMRYPLDYAAGTGNVEAAALSTMQGTAHMHSQVIERWVIKRVGGSDAVVEGTLTTYKEYAPGQILPYQRFVLNNPSAIQ